MKSGFDTFNPFGKKSKISSNSANNLLLDIEEESQVSQRNLPKKHLKNIKPNSNQHRSRTKSKKRKSPKSSKNKSQKNSKTNIKKALRGLLLPSHLKKTLKKTVTPPKKTLLETYLIKSDRSLNRALNEKIMNVPLSRFDQRAKRMKKKFPRWKKSANLRRASGFVTFKRSIQLLNLKLKKKKLLKRQTIKPKHKMRFALKTRFKLKEKLKKMYKNFLKLHPWKNLDMFKARQEALEKKKKFGTMPGARLSNNDGRNGLTKHDCKKHGGKGHCKDSYHHRNLKRAVSYSNPMSRSINGKFMRCWSWYNVIIIIY